MRLTLARLSQEPTEGKSLLTRPRSLQASLLRIILSTHPPGVWVSELETRTNRAVRNTRQEHLAVHQVCEAQLAELLETDAARALARKEEVAAAQAELDEKRSATEADVEAAFESLFAVPPPAASASGSASR